MIQENFFNLLQILLNAQQDRDETTLTINHLSNTDWEDFSEFVSQHHMLPYIYSHIYRLEAIENIPVEKLRLMKESYLRTAGRNTVAMIEVEQILTAFYQNEIPFIGLKGIYLVEAIPEFFGARTFGDIDILVQKHDISKAIANLKEMGYEMKTYFNIHDVNIDIKHVPPMLKSQRLPVEIHWTLLEEDEPFTIDEKGLWERAVPARIADVDALALSPEDLILHLCLHLGYQHHFKLGLRSLYDIVEVLRFFNGQINWELVAQIAREWGAIRVTWLTLTLAQNLLGAEVPRSVLKKLQPEFVDPWVIDEAQSQLLNTRITTSPMTPDLADLAERKGVFSKIKLILSRVFLPKQTMARLYGVQPTSIRIFGCYFKRLIDLVRYYRSSVVGIMRKNEEILQKAENQISNDALKFWLGHK